MSEPPRTYSTSHLRRQREAHAKADGYGGHRHLYLHDTIRRVAPRLGVAPTWLDYGCGKGRFIGEIRPFGLFASITGYDPAVEAFGARPGGRFNLVTCLDVLDTVEPSFVAAVLEDVAEFTAGIALFDCLTRPKPGTRLRPHPAFYWTHLVRQHMQVTASRVEFPGIEGFERVVIEASPRA